MWIPILIAILVYAVVASFTVGCISCYEETRCKVASTSSYVMAFVWPLTVIGVVAAVFMFPVFLAGFFSTNFVYKVQRKRRR